MEDRSKRQLSTTITPERSDVRKKHLESDGEQLKEKSPRKTLLAESSTMSDSSDTESGIAGIEIFCTETPVQVTLTLTGQDAAIIIVI